MYFDYITKKLKEIAVLREQILKEQGITPSSENFKTGGDRRIFKRTFDSIKDIKIACIMDEFTFSCYAPECQLFPVTPDNWQNVFEQQDPDLFFIESAWRGFNESWYNTVSKLTRELLSIIYYCNKKDIPILFWSKEDPVHFETFINVAKQSDFVFTTDIDCMSEYKAILNHNRVYLLPFAAQPKYHNPIEKYDRIDKFCFAGSYYDRYAERKNNIQTFIDVLSQANGIEIYDRNFYRDHPAYKFPESFKKYIVGTLAHNEIDKAYKGYRFGVNMNSIKQSQSMFARRVYELLASNTITVSNYSRGVRNFFGDLVVCTDDGNYLKECIDRFQDDAYYKKMALLGLRKVLSEDTYAHRLNYLLSIVFDGYTDPPLGNELIAVISVAERRAQIDSIIANFKRQSYSNKKLYIEYADAEDVENYGDDIQIIKDIDQGCFETVIAKEASYIAFFCDADYYGENYLMDMALAFTYSETGVVCKGAYYKNANSVIELNNGDKRYVYVAESAIKISLINKSTVNYEYVIDFKTNPNAKTNGHALSIDEFNYCADFNGESCDIVDDMFVANKGLPIAKILSLSAQINGNSVSKFTNLDLSEAFAFAKKHEQIKLKYNGEHIVLDSSLGEEYVYIYITKKYSLDFLKIKKKYLCFVRAEISENFLVGLVNFFLDEKGNRIGHAMIRRNVQNKIDIPEEATHIQIAFRVQFSGVCTIKEILFSEDSSDSGVFINSSNVLLISEWFPMYDDLYRYAFISSRLEGYKKLGRLVDVYKLNDTLKSEYYEFKGLDVLSGVHDRLHLALNNPNIDTILIHFLNKKIWNTIKHHVRGRKLVVWIHGSEIQPWTRRTFNFANSNELERGKGFSEERMTFWKELFRIAEEDSGYNFHFVFVSKYFYKTVCEDYGIELAPDKYSVIHNYIDEDKFLYSEKTVDMRKKILSIRPFTKPVYANDLSAKAIVELSKKDFFEDLKFKIIGEGALFNRTVKPLIKFENVETEERFLTQTEIAELHKQHGIFLVPSRLDSQGVSRDEAMASGLVPITNSVAAIPEFVDESCAILADEEDYIGLAKGIEKLYRDPELFLEMSQNASKRVRSQSCFENTIAKELELF